MNVPTALYRCLDAHGSLIYIGITASPPTRFASHRRTSAWWPRVARVAIIWFDSRDLAATAEAKAVATEHPEYNHNLRRRAPTPPGMSYNVTGRRKLIT